MRNRAVIAIVTLAILFGSSGIAQAGTVYEVTHGWNIKNAKGQLMATPMMRIRWEGGRRYVQDLVSLTCWDGNGYLFYKGCSTYHSKVNGTYPSMYWEVTWHWTLGLDPINLAVRYYCRAEGNVWAGGGFTSSIVCDYGG